MSRLYSVILIVIALAAAVWCICTGYPNWRICFAITLAAALSEIMKLTGVDPMKGVTNEVIRFWVAVGLLIIGIVLIIITDSTILSIVSAILLGISVKTMPHL